MVDIKDMLALRKNEMERHDYAHRYLRGDHDVLYAQPDAAIEFRWILERSRVNFIPLAVDGIAQALYVDGYAPAEPGDEAKSAGWKDWQANKMDARQTGVHRPALVYGASYVHVVPGDPVPLWVPRSPRKCTTAYEEPATDEWPVAALIHTSTTGSVSEYKLLTADEGVKVYEVPEHGPPRQVREEENLTPGMVPIVRFLNEYSADGEITGEVERLTVMQDQINMTTFGLLMAQHYSAFRQKWATGLDIPRDDKNRPIETFKVAVTRMFTAEDPDTRFGEFTETNLAGYLQSRDSTVQALAMIGQVPPHSLLGHMANLSADAIVAAGEQRAAKVRERQSLFGESWEQVFRLSASLRGDETGANDTESQVRWRDTESRSLSQTADALGKLAQMLGVPVEILWEKIPGWTSQDVKRAREARDSATPFAELDELLARQIT